MKRLQVQVLSLSILALGVMACVLTPTPTPTPTSASLNGTWVGLTSQGEPITLEIADGMVRRISFVITVTGDGWTARSEQVYATAVPVENRGFQTRISDDGWNVAITAMADGQMIGVIQVVHHHPQGMGDGCATVTFQAAQVVVGLVE